MQTGTYIQGFNAQKASVTNRIFVSNTLLANLSSGALVTLTPEMAQHLPLPSTYKNGDLLHLLSDGTLIQLRPQFNAFAIWGNLKNDLVSKSRGLQSWNVDNTQIFDTVSLGSSLVSNRNPLIHNFGGVIVPELSHYNDMAILGGNDHTDIFFSGQQSENGLPFIMRLRYENKGFKGAKVIVSSSATMSGQTTAPGVAVNSAGTVLTTLLVLKENAISRDQGVPVPIAFDADFPESDGTDGEPFQPFSLEGILNTFGSVNSLGMTTDSYGNFVIANASDSPARSFKSGVFVVTSDLTGGTLNDLVFAVPEKSSGSFNEFDVAVSPNNQVVYATTSDRGSWPNQRVRRFSFPLLPDVTPQDTPTGWDSPVVISTQTGTHTDAEQIAAGDEIYVDIAVRNRSWHQLLPTPSENLFFVQVFVDDESAPRALRLVPAPIAPNAFQLFQEVPLGALSAGTHRVKVVVDPLRQQPEINESNNVFERTVTVSPPMVSFEQATSSAMESAGVAQRQPDRRTDDDRVGRQPYVHRSADQ